ncbi:hypothetical protein MG293_009331 [Ovis ammon polii]|uniref:Uncharacterized protein n=1 Tax=Ovis ammon polii TaxID=230172 RepID=A0AAD4UB35_OVIAM|nr:hypothetical protein MG293_009331 [Ovis ammon polii]
MTQPNGHITVSEGPPVELMCNHSSSAQTNLFCSVISMELMMTADSGTCFCAVQRSAPQAPAALQPVLIPSAGLSPPSSHSHTMTRYQVFALFSISYLHRIWCGTESYSRPARHIRSTGTVSHPELSVCNNLELLLPVLVQAASQRRDDLPYSSGEIIQKRLHSVSFHCSAMLLLLISILGMIFAPRDSRGQSLTQPDDPVLVSEGTSLELKCNYS